MLQRSEFSREAKAFVLPCGSTPQAKTIGKERSINSRKAVLMVCMWLAFNFVSALRSKVTDTASSTRRVADKKSSNGNPGSPWHADSR